MNIAPSSYLPKQYALVLEHNESLFDSMNQIFCFYDNGVKEVLKLMLLNYYHTDEPIEHYPGYEYHYVFDSLDEWLMNKEDSNSVFNVSTEDIYQTIKFACDYLDVCLYHSMSVFFKRTQFRVIQVIDMTPTHCDRFEFLITLEFL